jgi:hypothetical protein
MTSDTTCHVCRQTITDDCWVNVVFGDVVRRVCDLCIERADEGRDLIERLSYENPEGLPEFNGAFNVW